MTLRLYIDLDEMLSNQHVSYAGTSVASAAEYHLRKKDEGIARDVFGDGVRIRHGPVICWRDTVARILMAQGWKSGRVASTTPAAPILREQAVALAALVEMTTMRP